MARAGFPGDSAAYMRVYAIGDIHGRFDLLTRLYESIRRDLEESPPVVSLEIFLGDYIDRGPQSREVLEWLVASEPATGRRVCLMGNHEAMLLAALSDARCLADWLSNGGAQTLRSYGVPPPTSPAQSNGFQERADFIDAFPTAHRDFLESLHRAVEFGDYFFVHAGVSPSRPLHDQNRDDLIWIREPFLSSRADFGRIVVHGHTPVARPDIRPNRINIDTGAVFTGRLTCLVLEGAAMRVLSVDGSVTPPPGSLGSWI
ncbi:MAG: serine/threonine protein phosphatase [Rhizobiales bacterium]|nr:serine/threonine protein phosphatase [Hyphomicrobiales bacterium]